MRVYSSVLFLVFTSILFCPYPDLFEVCPHDSFSHIKSCLIFQDWCLALMAVTSFPYQLRFVFPLFWETTFLFQLSFQTQLLDTFSKGNVSDRFILVCKDDVVFYSLSFVLCGLTCTASNRPGINCSFLFASHIIYISL